MDARAVRHVHAVSSLVLLAAIVFCLFFQINKAGPFHDVNPFLDDPYDAVASLAVRRR